MAYGFDRGRYRENKRAVKDKELGPLVKTTMTRCIHCTRCIRFATEIAGVEELGATGRGENMEVGTYVEKALTSELSGNIIDLCPVGALTSKPYAFTARSWELRKTESVDVLDAVGSNIRIDARGPQVMRILPRLNEAVNEEWISDKSRFAYDGLLRQRLDRPYVRRDGKLVPASWDEAFGAIAERMRALPGDRMAAVAGDLACIESMFALRLLMDAAGSPHRDCRQDGAAIDPSVRAGYLFNTTIAGIEDADFCLLIGTDPRWEAPLVNARLRKRWRRGGFSVARVGARTETTYAVEELGNDPTLLAAIADGSHPLAQRLKDAKAPMLIVGMGAIGRPDGAAVLAAARRIADGCGLVRDGWNGFNLLHTAAARVGGLDVGFVPASGGRDMAGILAGAAAGDIGLVWLLGADEFDMARLGRAFVVYQGHHGDAGAHRADVVLPGAAYTEKDGLYANMEGRVQEGRRAVFPPGEAREDWKILRAFSAALGRPLPFDTLDELRRKIAGACPTLARREMVSPAPWALFGVAGTVQAAPFELPVADFYMTDPICRASTTMAECSELYVRGGDAARTGTHG